MKSQSITSVAIIAIILVISFIAFKVGNEASDSVGLAEVEVLAITTKKERYRKTIKIITGLFIIGLVGFFYANKKNKQ